MRIPLCVATLVAATLVPATLVPVPPAAAHGVNPADFNQVELARGEPEMGEPMSLAILPDRSALHTARSGEIRRTDADGNTKVIGKLQVYRHDEEGLQGIGVDPGFAENRHIYLYYAPLLNTPSGDAPSTGTDFSAWRGVNRLSRFTLNADFTIDFGSEKRVLDVPADRGMCCHVGGDIDFDAQGNLYLSTGDDSNPFESDGYTPIDERADRNPAYDAQRTAANTNDLRGKLLRIKVNDDASYSIPSGNLFPPGTPRTRPEIYSMGLRNPFRFSVDQPTGAIYLGEYGPDAGSYKPDRGPSGLVEFNRITQPGNLGWPYCVGTNTAQEAYVEYTFPDGPSGQPYDCDGPTNNSFRNTGLTTLPAAQPSWIKYDGCSLPEFGCGSESPMGGALYRFDENLDSAVKFPRELDGHYFAAEYGRRWLRMIDVNPDGSAGRISEFPWRGTQIIDTAFGPDGALYVLDYGTGYFAGDKNSALYRIEYDRSGNKAPTAKASANRTSGTAPLSVRFSSAGSSDPEGGALSYRWDFGDGTSSTAANPQKTFTTNGQRTVTLTVIDPGGRSASTNLTITVGNTAPTVRLRTPAAGQLFSFGDTIPFQIEVTDPEDGPVDCARVKLTYVLGHDSHGHPITSRNGCSGTITVPVDGEHDEAANIFAVFDAEYTDRGANGQPPLTTHVQNIGQPRHRQAEHFGTSHGVQLYDKSQAEGGRTVGDIHNGDWIAFQPYRLSNAGDFTARVSSGGSGGKLEVRTGSPTGKVIGSVDVPNTGSWENFVNVSVSLSGAPSSTTTLYLTFAGGDEALFDVDSFTFGSGSSNVLVFSKTAGFRHDSIAAGVQAIRELGFAVTATEDASVFTGDLSRYSAVVFLNTTGDVLDDAQQSAFENYIRRGGGYVGVHAAADTEYDWPFYGELVGAQFESHPHIQRATIKVEDRGHPATGHLGQTWSRVDEWYNYKTNPRDTARVLATLDESSYDGGNMGDHPHTWCKTVGSGRSFYTGNGHTRESYAEPEFRALLQGGIRYAAGTAPADCRPR